VTDAGRAARSDASTADASTADAADTAAAMDADVAPPDAGAAAASPCRRIEDPFERCCMDADPEDRALCFECGIVCL
jgi:hypothetical protein